MEGEGGFVVEVGGTVVVVGRTVVVTRLVVVARAVVVGAREVVVLPPGAPEPLPPETVVEVDEVRLDATWVDEVGGPLPVPGPPVASLPEAWTASTTATTTAAAMTPLPIEMAINLRRRLRARLALKRSMSS